MSTTSRPGGSDGSDGEPIDGSALESPMGDDQAPEASSQADSISAVSRNGDSEAELVSPPLADDPGFAPNEPTDGRERGDWRTRYDDPAARRGIRLEAAYVFIVHVLCLVGIAVIALRWPQGWLRLNNA